MAIISEQLVRRDATLRVPIKMTKRPARFKDTRVLHLLITWRACIFPITGEMFIAVNSIAFHQKYCPPRPARVSRANQPRVYSGVPSKLSARRILFPFAAVVPFVSFSLFSLCFCFFCLSPFFFKHSNPVLSHDDAKFRCNSVHRGLQPAVMALPFRVRDIRITTLRFVRFAFRATNPIPAHESGLFIFRT